MKYIYYKTDGTKKTIESKRALTLKKMQKLVGGYIEHLELNNGRCLMINEEGVLKDLPINPHIKQEETWVDRSTYGLRGDVIEGKCDKQGEFIGV